MRTLSPEERSTLHDAVQRLLTDHSSEAHVRQAMATPTGFDPVLWQKLGEMGITGLLIDEQFGGAGAGPVELELVMEAAGAALLCAPLLGSAVLAATLLQALPASDTATRLLPGIASGNCIAAVAITGTTGTWTQSGVAVQAAQASGQWSLTGTASYVIHAQNAHELLVVARTAAGMGVFAVPAAANGMTVAPLPAFDHTLRLARIDFAATPAQLTGDGVNAWPAVEQALNMARVALAGEQAGGARKMLEITVEYAKQRVQFGRAIGSFQAIKHMAADLLLESEGATSAARHAAQALADVDAAGGADAAVTLAAFACADAFSTVTATAVQMHGGIAFTWEHPAHLYLRRARAGAQLFGTSAFYRERYVQLLGG